MVALGLGPYIGSFEQEFLAFRPYVRWIAHVSDIDRIFLNTHYNRLFMYDFIPEDKKIPINRSITRDEFKLRGYINKDMEVRDFNFLVRNFKDTISKRTGINKKNIEIEYINYTKRIKPVSIDKKIFEPIEIPDIEIPEEHKNKIIIIPHKIENVKRMKEIIDNIDDSIVLGDWSSTNFQDDNVISDAPDYIENVYKYIIKYISEAKAVICPASFWTAVCNLQKIPVLSWGRNVNQYKHRGIYSFGNKRSVIFVTDKDVSSTRILNMFDYFLEEKLQ